MRICIDGRMLLKSGIGTYLKNVLFQIQDAPFEFQLIVHREAVQKLPWLSRFNPIFCEAPIYSVSEQIQLPRLIPPCDLFWATHFNIPVLPIRAKKKVVTVHDACHLAFFSHLRPQEKLYAKYIFFRLKKFAEHIITISDFSKRELCKYTKLSEEKITPIFCGVDQTRFFPEESSPAEVQERFGLPKKYILFVGNLKPHKNVRGLIKAFKHLEEKGLSDCQLVIIGKRAHLRTVDDIPPVPSVIFLENVDEKDLPLLYRGAALCILPSFYEGFGLPPLEAMSCGCPVVVSRAASLPEVCGSAAEYVDPYDFLDIARGIEKVLKDPLLQKELKAKGLERAQQFTWKSAAEQHLKIFEEVMGG